MKKYRLSKVNPRTVVDDLGNTVAVCVWKNAAQRIVRLLNAN